MTGDRLGVTTFKVEVTVSKKSNVVKPRAIVWLCAACGRVGKNRMTVGDESCYLHAQAVYADSIVRVGDKSHSYMSPEMARWADAKYGNNKGLLS